MGEQGSAPSVCSAGRARLHGWPEAGRPPAARLGFSLQANAKTREGTSHPDRNTQFEHINAGLTAFQAAGETASFAVKSIRRWWHELGAACYPGATRLLVTADCGGSNDVRVRLWKRELQVLADELAIAIAICYLPPGTSKWNRIEHRLFAFITQNWRGKLLVSHQVIVQLIANTRTKTGLTVACRIDASVCEKGIKVSDAEMAARNIQPANFHGKWNYTFAPRPPHT